MRDLKKLKKELSTGTVTDYNKINTDIIIEMMELEIKMLDSLPLSNNIRCLYEKYEKPKLSANKIQTALGESISNHIDFIDDELMVFNIGTREVIHRVEEIFNDNCKKFVIEKLCYLSINPEIHYVEKQEIIDYLLKNDEYVYLNSETVDLIRNSLEDRIVVLNPGEWMNETADKLLYDLKEDKLHKIPGRDQWIMINSSLDFRYIGEVYVHINYKENEFPKSIFS